MYAAGGRYSQASIARRGSNVPIHHQDCGIDHLQVIISHAAIVKANFTLSGCLLRRWNEAWPKLSNMPSECNGINNIAHANRSPYKVGNIHSRPFQAFLSIAASGGSHSFDLSSICSSVHQISHSFDDQYYITNTIISNSDLPP